jgi:uncharacterized repeat protein (TIGR01451 family)
MKKTRHVAPKALLLAAGFAIWAVSAMAQPAPSTEWNEKYRSNYEVPLGDYTGRSPFMQSAGGPAPAPAPKPAAAVKTGCSDPTWGLIRMTKTMPPETTVGAEFMAQLNVTAQACAARIIVRDTVPAGATFVRSEPPAQREGNELVWTFATMDAGQSQTIRVWFKADKEGTLVNCATVQADPRVCAAIVVGKPMLAIEKSVQPTVALGSNVTYNIVVRNTGTAVAKNVVLTDPVPEGMSGQPVTINLGDIAPGQSKPATVTFKAEKRGKVCNVATARISGAGGASSQVEVKADACTTVAQPGLKIEKSTTDKEIFINRTASYTILVSNTGDVPLTGVVVTDVAAPETTIVAAEGGTVSGSTATWNVGQLGVGEKKTLTVKIASKNPGRFCNTATVTTQQGLRDSSQACTEWLGVTGVLVEVVDDPDPIQVGEVTTFTIRVTNQGSSKAIEDVNVKGTFLAEMDAVTVSSGGTINGKAFTFPTVSSLAPKASVTYTIKAKGVKAGDHRLQVDVTTKARTSPITELESTTVY